MFWLSEKRNISRLLMFVEEIKEIKKNIFGTCVLIFINNVIKIARENKENYIMIL